MYMDIKSVINEEIRNYEYVNHQKILEVGEASSSPYEWYESNPIEGNLEYFFRTEDEDIYEVQMQDIGNYWNMDFKTRQGNFEDVLNKGRFWRVMATLAEVIRDFLKKIDPDVIRVSPAKNRKSDMRRHNIYKQYFEKSLPDYEVQPSGDYLYIYKRDGINEVVLDEIQENVYTIPELAQALGVHGHGRENIEILTNMLLNAFKRGGDPAVIEMYKELAGVEIEALRQGRYMFANLYDPETQQQ